MKELTIEQKAEAYDEAIKRAKELLEIGVKDTRDKMVVLSFFPELKESEDEKIRKELIQFIKNWKDHNNIGRPHDFPTLTRNVEQCDRYIAWLEKQGDKKPADMVEPTPAWSEVDKDFMYDTLSNLTELKNRYGEGYGNVGKCIEWVKTLKERYTWKPSDEQIEVLEHFVRSIGESGYASPYDKNTKLLYSLLDQLKKLKE